MISQVGRKLLKVNSGLQKMFRISFSFLSFSASFSLFVNRIPSYDRQVNCSFCVEMDERVAVASQSNVDFVLITAQFPVLDVSVNCTMDCVVHEVLCIQHYHSSVCFISHKGPPCLPYF